MLRRLLLALLLLPFAPGDATAEEPLDELLLGFDEPGDTAPTLDRSYSWREKLPAWLDIELSGSLGSSFNVAHERPAPGEIDWRGLSRFETRVDLAVTLEPLHSWRLRIARHVEYDLAYRMQGRDRYTDEVLDAYESEYELWVGFDDLYVQGSLLSNLDLKIGRQVVAWGKSDNIRITDVLNPVDNREPGVVDLEHLRLPALMSRLDLYLGDWSISGIVGHEVRLGKDPVYGSDFYPSTQPPPEKESPGWSIDNQELALAVHSHFSGWDLSFYGAHYFDDQAHLELEQVPGSPPRQVLRHSRLTMAGVAFDVALGSWLLRGEAAALHGLEYFATPGETRWRLDALIGMTYSGFAETVISLEVANRHLFGHETAMEAPPDAVVEDEVQYALRVGRELLHDRVLLMALVSAFGPLAERGSLVRFNGRLQCTDVVSVSAGVIFYREGDAPRFATIGDNDRVFVDMTLAL